MAPILHRMRFELGKRLWRAQRRRLCAGATLLAYLVTAIGVPVPQTGAESAHACGQLVCGCGTAEQCKASGCCCSHGTPQVTPEEPEPGDCCTKKKPAKSCCTEKKSVAQEPTQAKAKPTDGKVRWIVGIAAKKCRGGGTEWLNCDAVGLPMTLPISWHPGWPYCHSVPLLNEYSYVLAVDHLDPPPRFAAV